MPFRIAYLLAWWRKEPSRFCCSFMVGTKVIEEILTVAVLPAFGQLKGKKVVTNPRDVSTSHLKPNSRSFLIYHHKPQSLPALLF